MAYIALHDGEEKGAFEVPFQTDAYCTECGERMRVWRESQDGTARHFKHVSEMHGGGEGGGLTNNCSGGEGDQHRKWKNFAAERLYEEFDGIVEATVEKRLHAPHTGKDHRYADAAITFEKWDEQMGVGLAVEVQHKNRDKDIEATTRDYLKQNMAVAWLDENDFSETGCRLNEADFRDRASEKPSPLYFKSTAVPWYLHLESHVEPTLHSIRIAREELNWDECDHELQKREYCVPARLPNEFYDEHAQRIWRNQDWEEIFRIPSGKRYRMEALAPRSPTTNATRVSLPPDYFSWLRRWFWFNTPFEEKLDPPEKYEKNIDFSYDIEAAFPAHWDYTDQLYNHLGENNASRLCSKCGTTATVYVHGGGFRCGDCGPFPNHVKRSTSQGE